MKTAKDLLSLMIVMFFLNSCNKSESNLAEDKILSVPSILYSSCKTSLKSTAEEEEYIEYQTTQNNYLLIKHVNARLNCCPDSIKVISQIAEGKICYSIFEKKLQCNCNCAYDITFTTGPLEYASYKVKANVRSGTAVEFSINFTKDTNGKFVIGNGY